VTWVKAADVDTVVNGALPIPASFIYTYQNPDKTTATISLTSPTANATFATGSNIPLTVNAADPNGAVRKVEYFANGTKIGESTTAPFSFTWNNVPEGRYTITARLLDRQGYIVDIPTGNAVTIAVGNVNPLALLVTGGTPSNGDNAVAAHLRTLGWDVQMITAPVAQSTDAAGKKLIVVSSSVTSGDVNTKFRGAAVPVLWWEASNADDFGIEAGNVNGTTIASQTDIFISDATHPLAAGLPAGIVTVYTAPDTISTFTTPVAGAVIVAKTADEATPVIAALEKGAALNTVAGATTAPERRVFFFLQDNGASVLTADGTKLFDAAVAWLTGGGNQPQPAQMTAALSGNNINITWTNGGTLEWTSALAPGATWTSTNDSDGSYSEAINTAQNKFFRVRN
jgi:hypothetical protein